MVMQHRVGHFEQARDVSGRSTSEEPAAQLVSAGLGQPNLHSWCRYESPHTHGGGKKDAPLPEFCLLETPTRHWLLRPRHRDLRAHHQRNCRRINDRHQLRRGASRKAYGQCSRLVKGAVHRAGHKGHRAFRSKSICAGAAADPARAAVPARPVGEPVAATRLPRTWLWADAATMFYLPAAHRQGLDALERDRPPRGAYFSPLCPEWEQGGAVIEARTPERCSRPAANDG